MILQCSQCQARYLVPAGAIGAEGRTVRCARCGHSWFEKSSMTDLDAMLGDIRPRPIPPGSNLPAVQAAGAGMGLRLATLAAVIVTALLLAFTLKPGLFGYPPSKGIALADVSMTRETRQAQGEYATYEISGKILNTTDGALEAPVLRVTLIDAEGSALQYWDFSDPGKIIGAGKDIPFTTGTLEPRFSRGAKFVVEMGNALELSLRRKPAG